MVQSLSVVPLAYELTDNRYTDNSGVSGQVHARPRCVFYFLGQVNLRKGVARLLDAIRQLKNEPIEFQFVGPVQVAVPRI